MGNAENRMNMIKRCIIHPMFSFYVDHPLWSVIIWWFKARNIGILLFSLMHHACTWSCVKRPPNSFFLHSSNAKKRDSYCLRRDNIKLNPPIPLDTFNLLHMRGSRVTPCIRCQSLGYTMHFCRSEFLWIVKSLHTWLVNSTYWPHWTNSSANICLFSDKVNFFPMP
jgi:hypothetical protein